MEDQSMFEILEIQNILNDFFKAGLKRYCIDEKLKENFYLYSRMLKSSIFRAEVKGVFRRCFICYKNLLESIFELECSHLICKECYSKEKYFVRVEDSKCFRCNCTRVTPLEKIASLELNR